MSNFPGSLDSPDTTMQGNTYFTGDDHALQHRTANSAIVAIETNLGTNSATGILGAFSGNDKAVRHQGGTFQIAHFGTFIAPVINTGISGSGIAAGSDVTAGTSNTLIVTPKSIGDSMLGLIAKNTLGLVNYMNYATGDQTTASATYVQIANFAQTLTTYGGQLMIILSGAFSTTTASTEITVDIDGDTIGGSGNFMAIVTGTSVISATGTRVKSVAAGSHTIKPVFLNSGGGTSKLPAYNSITMLIMELPW